MRMKERKEKRDSGMEIEKYYAQHIRKALQNVCEGISASERLKTEIDETIRRKENKSMKTISMKKIAIGVAAACLCLSGAAFAGHTAYFSSGVPSEPEYETYTQMCEAEERFGYPVDYVEKFSNNYIFAGASIGTSYAHDESGSRIYSYQEMDIDYQKAGEPRIYLTIEKNIENITNDKEPDAVRICGDITIEYRETDYQFVTTDYVVTEKEKAAMDAGEIVISNGADENEIRKCYVVEWNKDGLHYYLGGFDVSLTPEEMMDMAQEIILAE